MAGMRASLLAVPLAAALALGGCSGDDTTSAAPAWGPAFDASSVGWLLSVWGPSGDDLTTVGGSPNHGLMMHFDGTRWTTVDLGVDVPLLDWVFGFAADDIFAVGRLGTVLHWDGTAWTPMDTPTTSDLWGVWGAAPDDLWAVGGSGMMGDAPVVLHYDGTAWTNADLPTLARPNVSAFYKVWGTAADDVWMVGKNGAILHWDGSAFREDGAGTSDDLISVWGVAPDRVAAVGGRSNGVVAVFDGTEWHSQMLVPLPGLNGVWMRDPNVIHAVGQLGTIVTIDFDSLTYVEHDQDTQLAFHSVFGDDSPKLTTVGGDFALQGGPYQGIAFTRALVAGE